VGEDVRRKNCFFVLFFLFLKRKQVPFAASIIFTDQQHGTARQSRSTAQTKFVGLMFPCIPETDLRSICPTPAKNLFFLIPVRFFAGPGGGDLIPLVSCSVQSSSFPAKRSTGTFEQQRATPKNPAAVNSRSRDLLSQQLESLPEALALSRRTRGTGDPGGFLIKEPADQVMPPRAGTCAVSYLSPSCETLRRPSHGSSLFLASSYGVSAAQIRRLWSRMLSNRRIHLQCCAKADGVLVNLYGPKVSPARL